MNNQEIPTHALIDCGATGIAFMDQDCARHHQMPHEELKPKRQVAVIDRGNLESGDITHVAKVGMMIQYHREQLPRFVTKLRHYPIVHGILSWRSQDVAVRFACNMGTFGLQYCMTHCHDAHITVQRVTEEPPEPVYFLSKGIFAQQIRPQRPFRGNIVMLSGSSCFRTVKKGNLTVFKASLYDINKAIEAKYWRECPMKELVSKLYH